MVTRMRMAEEREDEKEEALALLAMEDDGKGASGVTQQEDPMWDFGK
jgi:hypothetical protein